MGFSPNAFYLTYDVANDKFCATAVDSGNLTHSSRLFSEKVDAMNWLSRIMIDPAALDESELSNRLSDCPKNPLKSIP